MKKNRLPKYWVVKNDGSKEFKKVQKHTDKHGDDGNDINWYRYDYLGFDGCESNKGYFGSNYISSFSNNPTVLTLSEFIDMTKEEEFKVGDKISVHGTTAKVSGIDSRRNYDLVFYEILGVVDHFTSGCYDVINGDIFKIEEEFTRGEIVQVRDNEDGKWMDRVFLTKIEGTDIDSIIVVSNYDEGCFEDGDDFIWQCWKYIQKKPKEDKVKLTLEVNGKEVDPNTLSEESWANLRKGK